MSGTQRIHVIRHADALDRDSWTADDDLRPLSWRGLEQAQALAGRFTEPLAAVYCSPSLRCIATVLPLARAADVPIATRAELHEGCDAAVMLSALTSQQQSPLVACTHGDVLADLLGLVIARGLMLESLQAEMGSTWTIELFDGDITAARYTGPV